MGRSADPEPWGGLEAGRGHDRGVELAQTLRICPAENRQDGAGEAAAATRLKLGWNLGARSLRYTYSDVRLDAVGEDGRRVLEGALDPERVVGVRWNWGSPDVAEVGRLRVHDVSRG